jgi:hypothetical protein
MSDRRKRRNSISGQFASRLIERPALRVLSYIQRPGLTITVGKSKDGNSSGAGLPAWAELAPAGQRTVDLPPDVLYVHILADGDDPGEPAVSDAALRWEHEVHRVLIARPPAGMDFNDLLVGRAPRIEARAP